MSFKLGSEDRKLVREAIEQHVLKVPAQDQMRVSKRMLTNVRESGGIAKAAADARKRSLPSQDGQSGPKRRRESVAEPMNTSE